LESVSQPEQASPKGLLESVSQQVSDFKEAISNLSFDIIHKSSQILLKPSAQVLI
jgi:hypothetical protein